MLKFTKKRVFHPPTDPSKREDFIDYTEQRAEAATSDAIARTLAEARWQQPRIQDAKPHLRSITQPSERTGNRAQLAKQEKGRLLQIADERFLEQPQIEAALDEIAERHGPERVEAIDEDRYSRLAGEINGHPLWHISQNMIAAASISADELWPTRESSARGTRVGFFHKDQQHSRVPRVR